MSVTLWPHCECKQRNIDVPPGHPASPRSFHRCNTDKRNWSSPLRYEREWDKQWVWYFDVTSNQTRITKDKHKNVQTGRPGPMRSFHHCNQYKHTPTIASIVYFDKEWVWYYDVTANASKGILTYLLFAQGQRGRSIDATKINTRRSSLL